MEKDKRLLKGYSLNLDLNVEVFEPTSKEDLLKLIRDLPQKSLVSVMGSGLSYGDSFFPPQGDDSITISTRLLKNNLTIDLHRKELTVSSGYKLNEILSFISNYNFIINALPGTGDVSLGGAIASNVHGKDSWRVGNFNNNIVSLLTCDRQGFIHNLSIEEINKKRFILGVDLIILEATLKLQQKTNLYIEYSERSFDSIENGIDLLITSRNDFDFIVGWVDCFNLKNKKPTGRGYISQAKFTGNDNKLERSKPQNPKVNRYIFGLNPIIFWRIIRYFYNPKTLKIFNSIKFRLAQNKFTKNITRETHLLNWNFIHHKLPNMNLLHLPSGFIEIQAFFKLDTASSSVRELINYCNEKKLQSELCGIKIHPKKQGMNEPGFYDSESVSIGIDVGLRRVRNAESNLNLTKMIDLIIDLGGNIYLTKDSICISRQIEMMYPEYHLLLCEKIKNSDPIFKSGQTERFTRGVI